MVQPHDASATLPRPSIYRERAWLFAGAVFAVCALVAIPAKSGVTSDSVPEGTLPQVAALPPGAVDVAPAPGATDVALIKRVDAKPQPSSEQQRQLMMLLLMNSAGPVRPFGGLGR